jgi:hypothetical protein
MNSNRYPNKNSQQAQTQPVAAPITPLADPFPTIPKLYTQQQQDTSMYPLAMFLAAKAGINLPNPTNSLAARPDPGSAMPSSYLQSPAQGLPVVQAGTKAGGNK